MGGKTRPPYPRDFARRRYVCCEPVPREPVQDPRRELGDLRNALLGAPGQENSLRRVAEALMEGVRGQAPRPTMCEVVSDHTATLLACAASEFESARAIRVVRLAGIEPATSCSAGMSYIHGRFSNDLDLPMTRPNICLHNLRPHATHHRALPKIKKIGAHATSPPGPNGHRESLCPRVRESKGLRRNPHSSEGRPRAGPASRNGRPVDGRARPRARRRRR